MKSIALVLLFADDRNSLELGPVLWPALDEVAQLYGRLPDPPRFERYYFARKIPDALRGETESTRTAIRKLFEEKEWEETRGRYSRTWDARKLIEQVRAFLSVDPDGLVVVFDHEITPPKGWRYIIWDGAEPDFVVSVAPTDPLYWSEKGGNRLAVLKHRVRTAALSAVGETLGLERCRNPGCVLFANVDAVTVLDRMVRIGPEHGIGPLDGRGYDPQPDDPARVQPLIDEPPAPPIEFLA